MAHPLTPADPEQKLQDWALELGCTPEELRSAIGETGRVLFEVTPAEQFNLDLEPAGGE